MNYRQAIDQVLETFKKCEVIKLNEILSISTLDRLTHIYKSFDNSTEFFNKYIILNSGNKNHLVTIKENRIYAHPIGYDSIEQHIIDYIFPEYNKSKNDILTLEPNTNILINKIKSFLIVNSFLDITTIIKNEKFVFENTDFLIQNRIIMINIKNHNEIQVTYMTTDEKRFEIFIYNKMLDPNDYYKKEPFTILPNSKR